MTRGIRACTALAFLGLLAKLAAGYGVYAVARDVFDTETGNQVVERMLSGDAARDFLRERWRASTYLGATAHLQVMAIGIAGTLLAVAASGGAWAGMALAIAVLVGVPLDVPLGIVHLAYMSSGTLPALPPEVTWSAVPKDLFEVMAYAAGEPRRPPLWGGVNLIIYIVLLSPSVVAATVVVSATWAPEAVQRRGAGISMPGGA